MIRFNHQMEDKLKEVWESHGRVVFLCKGGMEISIFGICIGLGGILTESTEVMCARRRGAESLVV